jgi:hypothetical protein
MLRQLIQLSHFDGLDRVEEVVECRVIGVTINVPEADGTVGLSLLSSEEGEISELANDHLNEVSGLGLEVLHIIFILLLVLLNLSHDSAEVALNEAHECLLVGILHLFEFKGLRDIAIRGRVLRNIDSEDNIFVGVFLSVAISADGVSREFADPLVVGNIGLFFLHFLYLFNVGLFLCFFFSWETIFIGILGMLRLGMSDGLEHSLSYFESSFA